VNYGYAVAKTTYGTIGIKTWIFRGMYGDQNQVLETDVRPGGPMRRGRR
jgi:small subunit ribosomal protein S3